MVRQAQAPLSGLRVRPEDFADGNLSGPHSPRLRAVQAHLYSSLARNPSDSSVSRWTAPGDGCGACRPRSTFAASARGPQTWPDRGLGLAVRPFLTLDETLAWILRRLAYRRSSPVRMWRPWSFRIVPAQCPACCPSEVAGSAPSDVSTAGRHHHGSIDRRWFRSGHRPRRSPASLVLW